MRTRAQFEERVLARPDDVEWTPSPMAGVEHRMLDRIGDEVFQRRNDGCGWPFACLHYFDSYTMTNTTGANASITVALDLPDGYFFAYTTFDPNDTATGCLDGTSEFFGDLARLDPIELAAGASLAFVVSEVDELLGLGPYTLDLIRNGCGVGFVADDEECDDNNLTGGDGCDRLCLVEDGFIRDDESPSGCEPSECGDGLISVVVAETCDDGNTTCRDVCSDDCRTEDEG